MNASPDVRRCSSIRGLAWLFVATAACCLPHRAAAAMDANVSCMLPGEIRTVGGHPTMGARHAVQTTAEDCQQRGGEYTVPPAVAAPVAPVVDATDTTPVRCLLPRQTRQLGSKVRYSAKSRLIRTTRSECKAKQGRELANRTR